MVDFRYHIVSLVSVFLALSVGIILGAGPLQNSIGQALSGEVSNLRETNADLKVEADELRTRAEQQDQAFDALAPRLLEGSLKGRTIAIVRLPQVADETYDSVVDKIGMAGGSLGTVVAVNDVWTNSAQTAFRSAFADQLKSYVAEASDATETNAQLNGALNQLVRQGDEEANNSTVFELMTGADTPLLAAVGELGTRADAVIILSPDVVEAEPSESKPVDADQVAQADYNVRTYADLANYLATKGPTVVLGAENSEHDVLTVMRNADSAASTVDSITTVAAHINAVIATAQAINGNTVNLGVGDGADAVVGEIVSAAVSEDKADDAQTEDAPADDGEGEGN